MTHVITGNAAINTFNTPRMVKCERNGQECYVNPNGLVTLEDDPWGAGKIARVDLCGKQLTDVEVSEDTFNKLTGDNSKLNILA